MKNVKMSALVLSLVALIGSANAAEKKAMCPCPCPPPPNPCCDDQGPCCNDRTFRMGFYTGINGGVNFLNFSKHNGRQYHANVGYELGWEFGYRWEQGIRLEVEAAYRHNHIDYVRYQGTNVNTGGHVWNAGAFLNGIFEFPGMCFNCVRPYIGVGLGYTHIAFDINGPFSKDSKSDGFAWQVIAGLDYWFNDRWDLAIEYRYREGPLTYLYDQTAQFALKYHF